MKISVCFTTNVLVRTMPGQLTGIPGVEDFPPSSLAPTLDGPALEVTPEPPLTTIYVVFVDFSLIEIT